MSAIRNLFTGMPPILDALAQQTNVQLPSFMPQVLRQNKPYEYMQTRGIPMSSFLPQTPLRAPSLAPLLCQSSEAVCTMYTHANLCV